MMSIWHAKGDDPAVSIPPILSVRILILPSIATSRGSRPPSSTRHIGRRPRRRRLATGTRGGTDRHRCSQPADGATGCPLPPPTRRMPMLTWEGHLSLPPVCRPSDRFCSSTRGPSVYRPRARDCRAQSCSRRRQARAQHQVWPFGTSLPSRPARSIARCCGWSLVGHPHTLRTR